jgi:hypothetical protein
MPMAMLLMKMASMRTIPEGTYLLPDFAAEIDENGDLVLTSLLEGEAQIDVGQWIGSGYHVINNGFIDASSVSPYNAVDKVFLKEHLLNVSDTKADAQTYCSQKAVEIYNSINISTKASYSNIYFSGSVKADYSKATTTKRNETLIKHFAILRQSFVKYEPPSNSDLVDHRDARFIEKINHLGSSIAANNPPESIRNEIKDLYSQYGTHLILGYELGGRAEMNYAFSNQASMEESDIAVAVKASYKGIDSSASGSVKTKIQNNINQINTYSDLKIHLPVGF